MGRLSKHAMLPDMECREPLKRELATIFAKCIECNLCVKECMFLKQYGTPKAIAASFDPAEDAKLKMPFECSLCSLCYAVCPVQINPKAMFLEMRREAVDRGRVEFSFHKVLRNYEKRGTSRLFTYYALPEGCDTVFFPGCALSGTRPGRVINVFEHMRKKIPSLGIVFDCCTKPSLDLGREDYFQKMFEEMHQYLIRHNVKTVLVACPSCYSTFAEYGVDLSVKTIYEVLDAETMLQKDSFSETVSVHDSCAVRFEEEIHSAVRALVHGLQIKVEETKYTGKKTFCCGEGGAVGFLNRELARHWGLRKKEENGNKRIVTYCAGCGNYLGAVAPTVHILDLVFEPAQAREGKSKVARPPLTYLNRLLLKRRFKKRLSVPVSRERKYRPL